MNYKEQNREAWEEAFEVHQRGYKIDLAEKLLDPSHSCLDQPAIETLNRIGVNGKVAGQFCCNNGRELLSVVKMGAAMGFGFDFAENYVQEATRLAQAADLNARFVATDIASIPAEFNDTCDLLLVTAGALTWFPDLSVFFRKASQVLKEQGVLLIHEVHPVTDMFAIPGESDFDEHNPEQIAYTYFRSNPWIENDGVDYVGGTQYKSKTFTSFSHTFAAIINAIVQNGFAIEELNEYATDISTSFKQISDQRIPLSYLLTARRAIVEAHSGSI